MFYIAVFVDFGRVQFLYANFSISIVRDSILTAKHRFPLKLNLSLKFLVKKYSFLSMLFKSFKTGTNRKNLKKLKLAH